MPTRDLSRLFRRKKLLFVSNRKLFPGILISGLGTKNLKFFFSGIKVGCDEKFLKQWWLQKKARFNFCLTKCLVLKIFMLVWQVWIDNGAKSTALRRLIKPNLFLVQVSWVIFNLTFYPYFAPLQAAQLGIHFLRKNSLHYQEEPV